MDSIWPNSSKRLVRSCCVAFLSTCPTHKVVLHTEITDKQITILNKKNYRPEFLYRRIQFTRAISVSSKSSRTLSQMTGSMFLDRTAEKFGADGRKALLLPLLFSLPCSSLAGVGTRRFPLSVSGPWAWAFPVFTFPRPWAGPWPPPLWGPAIRYKWALLYSGSET